MVDGDDNCDAYAVSLSLCVCVCAFQASTATGAARSVRTSTLASATDATVARVPNHPSMADPPQAASKSTTRRSGHQPPRSSRRQLCSLFRRLERARGLRRLSPCPVHASVLCLRPCCCPLCTVGRACVRAVPVVPLSRLLHVQSHERCSVLVSRVCAALRPPFPASLSQVRGPLHLRA